MANYRNPVPTVDAIIKMQDGIVLINRKNPPYGLALPGGFVDYGESFETAVIREVQEETGLEGSIVKQFHTYSDPKRDDRLHTITTVFIVSAAGKPIGADDALEAAIFSLDSLPEEIAFDHKDIIEDYKINRY
jgi:8-oxo-dGTP diphosphatase